MTMPLELPSFEARIKSLNIVLNDRDDRRALEEALHAARGDISRAVERLKDKLSAVTLVKLALAHSLAVWSNDHLSIMKAVTAQGEQRTVRDVALNFDIRKLAALVDAKAVPDDTIGATADEKKHNFAVILQNRLFTAEPTAVLQRMVQDAEVPIADAQHRAGVVTFLRNQPEFNIRTTSVYAALKHPDALKGVAEEHRARLTDRRINFGLTILHLDRRHLQPPCVLASARERHLSGDPPSPLGANRPSRRVECRGHRRDTVPEEFVHALGRQPGGQAAEALIHVQHPGGGGVDARDGLDDLGVGDRVGLVAATGFGCQHAE